MADDIDALRAHLQLRQFPLVGFSTGGHCSLLYAAQHPDVVERLVMIEAQPEPPATAFVWLRKYLDLPEVFDDVEEAVRIFRTNMTRAPEQELRHWITHNLVRREDGRWVLRYDPRLRSEHPPAGIRNEPEVAWAALPKISCPTMIMRGAESEMLSRSDAERIIATIPDGRVVEIEGAGHWAPLDNPEGFLNAISDFVGEP
jgi:pimeloyl-ACP methyl ester carboxylesterase